MKKLKTIEELKSYRQSILQNYDPNKIRIRICVTGCIAQGALEVRDALVTEINKLKVADKVEIVETGCFGFCAKAPVIAVDPQGIFYQQVSAKDAPEIISETALKGNIIDRLLYMDPETKQRAVYFEDVKFYKKQLKSVLYRCGRVDPTKISHYIANDGYSALEKVLSEVSPEGVIETVRISGLRGRGGGGFSTGLKWGFCRAAKGDVKYVICNADEGDPGAFMDRGILEGDPHSVLEGMIIAAYAIGAPEAYIYVRAEYPLAIKHLKIAISQAEELGLLGKNILGKDFSFNIKIKEGAGAFVCGEETALIASIEGKRGMPNSRPPFPAHKGLWGKPTNINNVETFANVPTIILKGAEWYANLGTEKSKGTKIFALAGKINNTGLIEVPMGMTMREVIYEIGGGIPRKRKFKAVLMGGPSGGCVPAQYLDLSIDYDSLIEIGAIMGSGGMIVMDERDCMVDIARYFLEFIQSESCGKCVPCRIGTKRMLEIVNRIVEGKGQEGDIELLEDLAKQIKITALCGLGQTAPNPVLSTIRYFRNEYENHIKGEHCPVCSKRNAPREKAEVEDSSR